MKLLFDTNVYFAIVYAPKLDAEVRAAIERAVPRTYLSSVVLAEMLQGARGDLGRARVRRLFRSLERAGRVVTPTHDDWALAAVVQGRVWDRSPTLRTKTLLHDALVAATARRIGATVVTENVRDFERIAPHVGHRAMTLAQLVAAGP